MLTLVHFATNRNEIVDGGKTISFGNKLNEKSPVYLRFGSAIMASPAKKDSAYSIQSLNIADESIPILDAQTGAPTILGSDEVFDALRERLNSNKADLILSIHGFACTLENALSNAAYFKSEYAPRGKNLEVAAFSWPSDGSTTPFLDYASDRDDARSSAKAVSRALHRLVAYLHALPPEKACNARIHVVAHSMGVYALRNALQALLSDFGGRRLPKLFSNIFLMAADEDNDALEHEAKLSRLPEMSDAVHLYYARDDLALSISDSTKGNPDRLGMTGPRTLTNMPQKVNLIDCTGFSGTGNITDANHQYYRLRAEIVSDIRQVIAGKDPDKVQGRKWIPSRSSFRIQPQG